MIFEAQYGTRRIRFHLKRTDKDSLKISVTPDGGVHAQAPHDASAEDLKARVAAKGRWIVRQQRLFAELNDPKVRGRYRSGQSIWYCGRQYRLRVRIGLQTKVEVGRGWIEVATPTRPKLNETVDAWLLNQAKRRLHQRFRRCAVLAARIGIDAESMELRRMKKRWGSCTKSGKILLNPLLVATPVDCVDYVILHELCHLHTHDHSKRFYRILSRLVPDWKRRKQRLENGRW